MPAAVDAPRILLDDCWNRIGVQGDQSCPRLGQHGHCRHCEVYAEAAASLRGQALSAGAREGWAQEHARVPSARAASTQAALVFRLGREWLALPAGLLVGAAESARPHRIPHRNAPMLLGLVNVRGRLYPSVSLAVALGITLEAPRPSGPVGGERRAFARLLLVSLGRHTYALPVDEVRGLQRYAVTDLQTAPTTVLQPFLQGVLALDSLQVGLLATLPLERLLAECLR